MKTEDRLNTVSRRGFIGTALGACAIVHITPLSAQVAPAGGALTKERRDRMRINLVRDR
jgi:hypothetical protein